MGFLDVFQWKDRFDRNRKLASLEQVEKRFERVDLNLRPLQAGHQISVLKLLAVGAVSTHPADKAVTSAKAPPRRQSAKRARCIKRMKAPLALRGRRVPELVNQSFGPFFSGLRETISDLSLLIIATQTGKAPPPCRVREATLPFPTLRVLDHHVNEIFGVPDGLQNRFGLHVPVSLVVAPNS